MSSISNQVDYGKVEAVIAYMNDRLSAGKLAKFSPKRYELKQNGAAYSVRPLPTTR